MQKCTLQMVEWNAHRKALESKINAIGATANAATLFEDIDKACSNEWAFLFLSADGFIVLRPRHDKSTYIHVMVAHCDSGQALPRYFPQILNLSRLGNAKFIEFTTARKGFDRLAPKFNFKHSGNDKHLTVWRYYIEE